MHEEKNTVENNNVIGFAKYLTPVEAFALSYGCSIGWGSLVMQASSFLPGAGPLGTILGYIIGIFIMLVIIGNYHNLMNKYPDSGGTFCYIKRVFGYDHAFLCAWFLVLTYISIVWANSAAASLLFRFVFGDIFRFGFLYVFDSQNIFLGEVLLSILFLLIFGSICTFKKEIAAKIQTIASFGLFFGILICFITIIIKHQFGSYNFEPYFIPNRNIFFQVFSIAMMTPWTFVGIESISHSSEEFKFSTNKSFSIMLFALLLGVISYIFLVISSVSVFPENYSNWFMYISDLKNLSGEASLPFLYAVNSSLGTFGTFVFFVTGFCGIITGIIGCFTSASRLLYSMAKDDLLPVFLGKLNSKQIPQNAICFIAIVSFFIPFIQKRGIGWIVDLTSFGAALSYAYTSACSYAVAKKENNKTQVFYGILGVIFSAIFTIYLLIPYRSVAALSKESYLIITLWCILGLLFFRSAFSANPKKLFKTANTVWISLIILILFTSQIWVNQTSQHISKKVINNIDTQYVNLLKTNNIILKKEDNAKVAQFLNTQIDVLNKTIFIYGIITLGFILLVLTIMFSIYKIIRKKEEQKEREKEEIERIHKIRIGFLFNMSHDIRTPMNAIIGYTTLAQKEKDISKIQEYLTKIGISSQQMLSILNDVIEMSRIESHRKELVLNETDLNTVIDEVCDVFAGDMEAKKIDFTVNKEDLTNPIVLCDKNCLIRVLFNIIGNALKFTPEKGNISLTISQSGRNDNIGNYTIVVKDDGIGISEEFLPKLFNAFEREKTSTDSGLQGTGLGLPISKSIIDLMKGSIEVNSKKGHGAEFTIKVPLEIVEKQKEVKEAEKSVDDKPDFSNMKLLLVEDIVINREIAKMLLGQLGFAVDCAENGKIAVDMYSNSKPGYYSAIIMDIQMPVMNGYDASKAIRSLENKEMANIPIIAMTANVLPEDIQKAKESGMNGHIAKPIDVANMTNTLVEILLKK